MSGSRATGTRRRVSLVGSWALVTLGLAWALFERPAPYINVSWREGLSEEERRHVERELYLENGDPVDGAWRYELASPRQSTIRAIVEHPAIRDTHRIDRGAAAVSDNAGFGTLRVWWVGPAHGRHGALIFRLLFAIVAIVTLASLKLDARRSGAVSTDGAPSQTRP